MEIKANRPSNQEGFTLIEILVVLSIVLILSHFYLSVQNRQPSEDTVDQFLETFENDLFYLQQYTMTKQIMPQLYFDPSNHMYSIRHASFAQPLIERKYREDIQVKLNNFKNPLTFTSRGNLSNPGSVRIIFKDYRFKITFSFGKGQFKIEKNKTSMQRINSII